MKKLYTKYLVERNLLAAKKRGLTEGQLLLDLQRVLRDHRRLSTIVNREAKCETCLHLKAHKPCNACIGCSKWEEKR